MDFLSDRNLWWLCGCKFQWCGCFRDQANSECIANRCLPPTNEWQTNAVRCEQLQLRDAGSNYCASLGKSESIRKSLSNLAKREIIIRLTQGIYLYSKIDKEFKNYAKDLMSLHELLRNGFRN